MQTSFSLRKVIGRVDVERILAVHDKTDRARDVKGALVEEDPCFGHMDRAVYHEERANVLALHVQENVRDGVEYPVVEEAKVLESCISCTALSM